MNKKRKIIQSEEAVSNIWISILLPLASVGITYVVAILIKSNGLKSTIQLLSFFVIVCAALLYIVIKIFVSANISKQEKILDEELVSSENAMLQKVNAVGFTGVFPEEELAHMEERCEYSEIWLVSYDLTEEINDGIYAGVVAKNVRRGVKYRYFTPKNDANTARIQMIKNRCHDNPNLEFYYLEPSFFFLVSEIDFSIYNPQVIGGDKVQEPKRCGYLGVNIEGLSDRYAVSMSDDLVDAIVYKLSINATDEYKA